MDEGSGARLAAVRDPLKGLTFATWDTRHAPDPDPWIAATMTAPTRPWTWSDVRPGKFAIAARAEGRQWVARRVELKAGAAETFDVAAQPKGGGSVVCEEGAAELLIDGDVPVAPLRIVRDLFRTRWDGVPPGKHAVRFPDGRRVDVRVADGETVTLKRDAK